MKALVLIRRGHFDVNKTLKTGIQFRIVELAESFRNELAQQ